MENENATPADQPKIVEQRVEVAYDPQAGLVVVTHRHPLELESANQHVAIPFSMVKLMAANVLFMELHTAGMIPIPPMAAPPPPSGLKLM